MKIINLVEDTKGNSGCGNEHGLSFYIETENHTILVDAGASDMFMNNAQLLGVDLQKVDTLVLSHGHYDHSGGIMPFTEINPTAKIYMRRNAGDDFYHGERYIGIDKKIPSLPQVVLTDDFLKIDDEISLFSGINGKRFRPEGNKQLSRKIGNMLVPDDFSHEQCVVLSSGGKNVLVSGCAHNGIVNILDKYEEIYKSQPDFVISGFHMIKKTGYSQQDIDDIKATAHELLNKKSVFYTGHCTGGEAFDIMKEIMKERLHVINSGDVLFDFLN